MRRTLMLSLLIISASATGQIRFDNYFTDKVLRFDFMFSGNSQNTTVYPMGMKEEPFWAGSNTNLIDPFNYGNFRYQVLMIGFRYAHLFQGIQFTLPGMADHCGSKNNIKKLLRGSHHAIPKETR